MSEFTIAPIAEAFMVRQHLLLHHLPVEYAQVYCSRFNNPYLHTIYRIFPRSGHKLCRWQDFEPIAASLSSPVLKLLHLEEEEIRLGVVRELPPYLEQYPHISDNLLYIQHLLQIRSAINPTDPIVAELSALLDPQLQKDFLLLEKLCPEQLQRSLSLKCPYRLERVRDLATRILQMPIKYLNLLDWHELHHDIEHIIARGQTIVCSAHPLEGEQIWTTSFDPWHYAAGYLDDYLESWSETQCARIELTTNAEVVRLLQRRSQGYGLEFEQLIRQHSMQELASNSLRPSRSWLEPPEPGMTFLTQAEAEQWDDDTRQHYYEEHYTIGYRLESGKLETIAPYNFTEFAKMPAL